jgi:hypothetical protein
MSFDKNNLQYLLIEWVKAIFNNIRTVQGVFGLLVTSGTVIGITVTNTPIKEILIGLLTIVLCIVVYISKPRIIFRLNDYLGKKLELSDLKDIPFKLPKIGLLGVSFVGKTTFLEALEFNSPPPERTSRPYACIIKIPKDVQISNSKLKYTIFIDSVGTRHETQFEILKQCNIVCLFLDHNDSYSDPSISRDRIKDQTKCPS